MIVNTLPVKTSGGALALAVMFSASEWANSTITIPKATHLREGEFVHILYHLVSGEYVTNTWAVVGTQVKKDSSGNIILTSTDAYDGKIIIC